MTIWDYVQMTAGALLGLLACVAVIWVLYLVAPENAGPLWTR